MKAWMAIGISMVLWGCVSQTTLDGRQVTQTDPAVEAEQAARERVALALGYLERGDLEAAKRNLDRALEHQPQSESALLTLAYYFEQVQETAQAGVVYRRVIDLHPHSADARNNYGVFLCRQGEWPQSERQLLAAIELPDYAKQGKSYENLARCALKAGLAEPAQQYFQMALKYDPGRTDLWLELAELAFRQQDYPQARLALSQYHAMNAASAATLWLGVEIESRANHKKAAQRFGAQLLVNYPESEQAKAYRAKNYQ
ncbi:type IV pilus assembly protein PilF [Ferrimonas sediminum]|uniref:Type IV pilus assembly protein PilF n=1 Tax=Ferrimonas sediminum TaxID=718193 RepID=A0A1G8LZN8_9GAMM|nr:type IV pilus biogenesis/stability protein PilW [Ferrimonas sediminum]SDI61174.1 type IV pilus assembly protein PilF [Ferrimonas sediminum]